MFVSKRVNPITVEWMLFLGFIGLPGLVAGAILLTGSNKWWEYASLFWFSSVFGVLCRFCCSRRLVRAIGLL
jgi:hypothetical protein